jgi:hypothetical protein
MRVNSWAGLSLSFGSNFSDEGHTCNLVGHYKEKSGVFRALFLLFRRVYILHIDQSCSKTDKQTGNIDRMNNTDRQTDINIETETVLVENAPNTVQTHRQKDRRRTHNQRTHSTPPLTAFGRKFV